MAKKFLTPIDLTGLELLNALAQNLATAPPHAPGRFYYDTTLNQFGISDGTTWTYAGSGGSQEDFDSMLWSALTSRTHEGITVHFNGDYDVQFTLKTANDQPNGLGGVRLATNEEALAGNMPGAIAITPESLKAVTNTLVSKTELKAEVTTYRLDEFSGPAAPLNLWTQRLINVGAPTAATDAATKGYVDGVAQGLDVKASVRAATTAGITLANVQTVDGVALVAGDRVLVKDQTSAFANGIYVVVAGGNWTRASDFNNSSNATPGAFTFVEEGTTNGDTGWVHTTNAPITFGTTALTWAQFSGGGSLTAGAGLAQTGSTFDVGAGNGITVAADTVAVDTAVVVRKYAETVGGTTSIAVTHNLGTQDVTYSIREVATNAFVDCDVVATSANTLTLGFAVAPAAASLRVVVHA